MLTKKPTLYLETSVPSYFVGKPSTDVITLGHQHITREWWEVQLANFDVFVSQLVIEEAARGAEDVAARRLSALGG